MAAMENPRIRAFAVDAAAFPDLARRSGVRSVPHTIIEGARRVSLPGGGPEERFLAALLEAAGG